MNKNIKQLKILKKNLKYKNNQKKIKKTKKTKKNAGYKLTSSWYLVETPQAANELTKRYKSRSTDKINSVDESLSKKQHVSSDSKYDSHI